MPIMETYHARFTGAFVARCPACGQVCAAWDDDDLDDNGNLTCDCEEDNDG
jgi:hypothetical protein